MSVRYRGKQIGWKHHAPVAVARRHETPARGDSQGAISRSRGKCLDVNMQVIEFVIGGKEVLVPCLGHWPTIGRNGYTHTTINGRLRRLSRAEKRMSMQTWVNRHGRSVSALNSLRKKGGGRKVDDYPMTWEQAVKYADPHNAIMTPELKSQMFRYRSVCQYMANVCKKYDYPLWSMALLSMKFCEEKCEAMVPTGGSFSPIFGRFRRMASGSNKIINWDVAPTRIWGPASARRWLPVLIAKLRRN